MNPEGPGQYLGPLDPKLIRLFSIAEIVDCGIPVSSESWF